MDQDTHGLAEAKAKLSEVIARARARGPQHITIHGRPAAVVVGAEEWDRRTRPRESLVEFFLNSPFRKHQVAIERMRGKMRDWEG
jgi:prevent-host-death family protein